MRAVLALAEADRRLSAGQLARQMQIPPRFLPQIMPGLVRNDILGRRLGRHGGYVLARAASEIPLLEAADAAPRPRSCVLRGGSCQREGCALHPAVAGAQEAVRTALGASDFGSLLKRRSVC